MFDPLIGSDNAAKPPNLGSDPDLFHPTPPFFLPALRRAVLNKEDLEKSNRYAQKVKKRVDS